VLFGLGVVPGLISTVIFALPAPIRLTHLGISSVPRPLIEAGQSFGATPMQLLWKIELPSAATTIIAGVTQCIMLSLSMVVIAALVGAGGLGVPVVRALNSVQVGMGFEAGFTIVLLGHHPWTVSADPKSAEPPDDSSSSGIPERRHSVRAATWPRGSQGHQGSPGRARRRRHSQRYPKQVRRHRRRRGRLLERGTRRNLRAHGLVRIGQVHSPSGRQWVEPRDPRPRPDSRRRRRRSTDAGAAIDVASCSTEQLREVRRLRVAMVFQQFGLLPWRTVRENVGFGLELRGETAAKRKSVVDEKLELVGLTQWAGRYVSELSGGMQQRVGLARAFATDADILLMDEPFSALDPLIRGKLQDELLALQERVKKTILFVSHDLDEALRLGDKISILQNGRIIQTGTAEDIVLAPADDYVAEFVRHMNPLDVLTGAMIMRERANLAREGDALWLDDLRRYRLSVNPADEALSLHLDGVAHDLRYVNDDAALGTIEPGLAVAPASFSLQSIIQLRQTTGHPVLLSEGGKIIGVACQTEIIKALAGSRQ
jgi:glycine betaine/proline transport system ATP-binding protein